MYAHTTVHIHPTSDRLLATSPPKLKLKILYQHHYSQQPESASAVRAALMQRCTSPTASPRPCRLPRRHSASGFFLCVSAGWTCSSDSVCQLGTGTRLPPLRPPPCASCALRPVASSAGRFARNASRAAQVQVRAVPLAGWTSDSSTEPQRAAVGGRVPSLAGAGILGSSIGRRTLDGWRRTRVFDV